MDVVKEVRQTFLNIDSGKFVLAHHRIYHGRILSLYFLLLWLGSLISVQLICWLKNPMMDSMLKLFFYDDYTNVRFDVIIARFPHIISSKLQKIKMMRRSL